MPAFLRHPLGWLLKSTEYVTAREIQSWHRTCAAYREGRYWLLQRVLLDVGRRPLIDSFELAVLAALLIVNAHLWELSVPYSGAAELSHHFDHLLGYFTTLWSIQATVAVLTYPIVIGLVTFLFGQRDSSVQRLYIYLADSCAILMGVSSLTLVLFMGLQYKFLWYCPFRDVEWTLVVDLVWFCSNIMGTIYFLHRSFWFILPGRRGAIITQYSLTIIWPQQARRLFKKFLLQAAHSDATLMPAGKGSVYFGSIWADMGEPAVQRHFRKQRYLADVHFRILNFVAWLWLRNNSKAARKGVKKTAQRSEPTLLFPVSFDLYYKGAAQLCRVNRGLVPPGFARLLTLLAFRFTKKARPKDGSTIDDVVAELQADVLEALAQRRFGAFESRYKAMIEFIVTIIQTSEYGGGREPKSNVSLLPVNSMGSESAYQSWLNAHYDITEACAAALPDHPEFFRFACYVPTRFFLPLRDLVHVDIPRYTMTISLHTFMALDDWWVLTAEGQGFVEHTKCSRITIRPPALTAYNEVLNAFVGAYEGMNRNYFRGAADLTFKDWQAAQDTMRLNIAHVGHVVVMVFHAVARGNKRGAEAATDMLQSWCDRLMLRLGNSLASQYRAWRITPFDIIDKTVEEAKTRAALLDIEDAEDGDASLLAGRAILNLWHDHICLTIYALLRWAVGCECDSSLPADLARILIQGTVLSEGATHAGSTRAVVTRSDLIAAIIRQQMPAMGVPGDQETYTSVLNSVYQRLSRVTDRPMIAGRVYSGGGTSLDNSTGAQLLYLMLLPESGWNAERQFGDFVGRLVAQETPTSEALKLHFEQMLRSLDDSSLAGLAQVFLCIKQSTRGDDFTEAKAKVKAQLEELVQLFARHIDAAIAQTGVNPTLLTRVADIATKAAFGEDGAAPIVLFKHITTATTTQNELHFRITDQDKSDFIGDDAKEGYFDDDFVDMAMRANVAAAVMSSVLKKLQLRSVDASTPEMYWKEFRHAVSDLEAKGLTPVLMLQNRVVPKWVWNWMLQGHYEQGYLPPELSVTKNEKLAEKSGYEATINGVDVYEATVPSGASVVLPLEALDTVRFKAFAGGRLVDVKAEPVKDNPARVDLVLSWGWEIDVPAQYAGMATKLVYGEKRARE